MIGRFRSEYHLVLLAAQFLTRLPLPPLEDYSEEKQAASVRHHPLIGYLIGGLAATVFWRVLIDFSTDDCSDHFDCMHTGANRWFS